MRRVEKAALGVVAVAIGGAAHAQLPAASPATVVPGNEAAQPAGQPGRAGGRRSYEAAWFAQFSPATALQIVQRVPGFAIDQVDPSVRGFAQSAGNVVINGQRPSSKSDTVETILGRIPASRVLRVEVGAGDLFGADYAGKSQVLNVVLTTAGGTTTNLELSTRRDFEGKLYPQGSISTLLRRGKSTFNAALTVQNQASTEEGYDRVTALPTGDLVEYREKTNRIRDPYVSGSASWDYNGGANRTAHVNVRTAFDRFALTQFNDVFPVGAPIRDDRLIQRYHTDEVELGGDVTRPLAGGGVKLVGLATRRYRDYSDVSLNRIGDVTIGGDTQRLKSSLAETLARATWSRTGWNGWSLEVGAEGVNNRLDSDTQLNELNADGTSTPLELPIARAVVEEWRGEAFVNAGHALAANLRADASLTYEASRLTVTGDAEAARTLTFLKPRVVLDWKPGPKWHAQLTLQRTVAQLQFEDFVGNAELSNDRVNGGNANLVPQRAWEALLTLERPILKEGLLRLEAGYNRVSLVQDRIPTEDGFDAPGNLGDGTVKIARARLEAPLARFGLKGMRVILYGSYVGSSVRDPYTLTDRPFSGNADFAGEATIRQDLTHFAWGVTLEGATNATFYRLNELDTQIQGFPFVTAFAEWRPNPRTTLTLTLENAANAAAGRRRTFFDPDRRTPDPFLLEVRERNRHLVPLLTFKKTFG